MSFVISAMPFMQVNLSAQGGDEITAFAIAPTPDTLSVMNDHSIVFRGRPAGFSLFYLANPEAAPPPVAAINGRTRFSFTLRLTDPGFFERFHPDFTSGVPQILLDNLDGAGAIQSSGPLSAGATVETADTIPLGGNPYPIAVDVAGGAPQRVDAVDRFTGALQGFSEFESEPTATEITVPVEIPAFSDPAVRMVAAAPSTLNAIVYADDEAAEAGATAVIDLFWDQPQTAVPAVSGAIFDIVFRPRP